MMGISCYLLNVVSKLNVLPNKYLYSLIAIILILNVIAGICLMVKKYWPKTITVILYILVLIISVLGIKYGEKTNEFLEKSFDNYKKEVTIYHVMVRSDRNFKSLSDLDNKDITYFTFYNDTDKIIDEINKNIKNADIRPHDDLYDTFINFLVGQLSAIVIDDGYLDVLSEDYKNLDKRLRTLYTFEVESLVKVEDEKKENNSPVKHKKINKRDNINIYLSGSDSRSKRIYNKSRSDVNMILSINKHTKTVLLTSIPRDYYVQVHGQTGLKDKLTHAGIYGLNISKETVEDLFDIEIDYSVKLGFSAVVELVDLVDGIDIESDIAFDSFHMPGWRVEKGINHMNGAKALAYARERYAYAGGDRHRILNQQQVLEATLSKLSHDKSLLTKYDKFLDSLSKLYITDIPRDVISEYVKMQLNDMSSWKFISQSVDGTGKMEHTYTAPKSNRYVMIPNQETVELARAKMKSVLEKK